MHAWLCHFVSQHARQHSSTKLACTNTAGAKIGILPKIESADSVGHLSDILDAADGAMVARGDLGAELPVQEVPFISQLLGMRSTSNVVYSSALTLNPVNGT